MLRNSRLRIVPVDWLWSWHDNPFVDTIRKGPREENPTTERKSTGRARDRLSDISLSLYREWERLGLPCEEDTVVVALSGGADSTALLLALEELFRLEKLHLRLTVAHLDHGLRGIAGVEDAQWVAAMARDLGFTAELGTADVGERASNARDNLEQAARRARYDFLKSVAEKSSSRVIVTGHTMDDQAETVMLRLLRGSGTEGLGGMDPVRAIVPDSDILLARPLLRWARRADTEGYCRDRGVAFRSDQMNEDERFSRTRVRRQLLPLMATFNPLVVESLSRAAELLRDDAALLSIAASELLRSASIEERESDNERGKAAATSLSVDVLARAPAALRRRALRLWISRQRGDLRRLEMIHLIGVEELLVGNRGGRRAELPGGTFVEIRRGRLRFHTK